MFGEDLLKYHGIGIKKNEYKKYKKVREFYISNDNSDCFSPYGTFSDNVFTGFKSDYDNRRLKIMQMNVLNDDDFHQTLALDNLRLHSYPQSSLNYKFALLYDWDSIKKGYLYIFNKSGTQVIKKIDEGDIYNHGLTRVLDDPVTGNIAVMYSWAGRSFYLKIFDRNLNVIKDNIYVVNDGPVFNDTSFFYNNYIYSYNRTGYTFVKYDYRTNTIVASYSGRSDAYKIVSNVNIEKLYLPDIGAILDFNLKEIEKNVYYTELYPLEGLPNLNGKCLLIDKYGFGVEYLLNAKGLNGRVLTELPYLSEHMYRYITADLKTIVFIRSNYIRVHIR
ncbi:hypothetical protein QB607_002853 [Clostridium botulinum]|nr:hypothetical protein [Clostridium botulinum]EKS4395329.1 hypothetical protein [Clostridium botulinum]